MKLSVTGNVHVIDDFLLLAHSIEKLNHDLMASVALCKQIGVPLAPSKKSSYIPFLGIILDAVHMEARLPDDKLEKAKSLLLVFRGKQKVTLKEPQTLIGVLNFALPLSFQAFLWRLIYLTMGVPKPHHHIRLTRETKPDLGVWWEFFLYFKGRSFFMDDSFFTGDYLQLYTDAVGGIGYGALCGAEWFCGKWPVAWRLFNIAVLELYPIMAAVRVWGASWANKSVCFFTENEALVPMIDNQTSLELHIMALLRPLVLACLRFNINFAARHIPGRINTLADKLSR